MIGMKGWFGPMRALTRIAQALETQNDLLRERMDLDYPPWRRPDYPRKLVEVNVPTTAEWNKEWRKTHGDEGDGDEELLRFP